MFNNLRTYDDYKLTSSPWIGRVPSDWRMERFKSLLAESATKGYPDEPLLAATQSHGVIRKSDYGNRTVTATKDLHLLKLVEVGDFVISLRSFQGGIERCHQRGIISPAYTVLRAKSDTYRDYLTHLFKSKAFVSSLALCVTGIREGQNIDYSKLSVELLPVPPIDEQAGIVKYLTHANARIDKAAASKRKLLDLLTEARKATIESVILGQRGLDLQQSSAPWLNTTPRHWEWYRCKTLVSVVTSGSRGWAEYYSDEGALFLQSGNLGRKLELKIDQVQRVKLPDMLEGIRTRIQPNDVLICITGALTGNVAIVPPDWSEEAYVNQHVALVRPRASSVHPEFLAYALSSSVGQTQFKGSEYGGTKQGLGLDDVKNVQVLLPPVSDQAATVSEVHDRTTQLDEARAKASREVALLNEFRARLIVDVVTGQVDVRDAAATLPEIDPNDLRRESDLLEDPDRTELDEAVIEAIEVGRS
jgi:type I restriction enzyme S subunit